MDNIIGKKLDGRYEIESFIGGGGMANIYKAKDLLNKNYVAVKILRDEFLANDDFVRRFKNESKAISILSHPNIVKVFDVSVSDKVQYIVMEYIDGINLKEYIQQRGVLSYKEALHFTTQILTALEHAHENGIVHRDVKPQNIMMLENGQIKVMDFGIARFTRSEVSTITDKAIGSVHYISPEQAKGDKTDARTDIYSVGVLLYEMMTGRLPFDSNNAVAIAIKQISDKAAPPRTINKDIPEALEEIIMKAMAKNTAERYKSASQMLGDIEEFKQNPSIQFQYKYIQDEPTRYIENVPKERTKDAAKNNKKRKAAAGANFVDKLPFADKLKKLPLVYLLMGSAAAVFIVSLIISTVILAIGGSALFSSKNDIALPNFVGMARSDVEGNAEYKFSIEFAEVFSTEVPAGTIIDQSPKPPKQVKESAKIKLKVSLGPEIIEVPDVAGYSRSEAEKKLVALGFSVKIMSVADEKVTPGLVIKTEPAKGEMVSTDNVVTIYLSTAKIDTDVTVPQVVGASNLTDAKKILENNRLKIGSITTVESTAAGGSIIAQNPPEGTVLASGSAVNVTVSTGYVTKTVTVTVNFTGAHQLNSHWEAKMNGNLVSSFDVSANTSPSWSFNVSGTGGTATIDIAGSEGSFTQVTVSFDNPQGVSTAFNRDTPPPSPSVPSSVPLPPSVAPSAPASAAPASTGASA